MMSRKDYIAIAKIIAECADIESPHSDKPMSLLVKEGYRSIAQDVRVAIAYKFADLAIEDNPEFNRDKFFIACGVKGNVK